ncbi:hypothetical protein ACFS5L_34635 [Streptomyces phyllanthi]|uniref:Uncharacterized protein n=1 Tax=Streptomyces phyllanthi TaxID=1803180 RepID=A0A5N8WEK2_9ACTN|nr:hypothetical protein [Streptomyces phyllanthi]MPY44844.1 hypothetical protein [Streptomyces phyllanthi]
MNLLPCGTATSRPRPVTGPEAVVLIVIIVVAGALAAVGLPAASVAILIAEAGTLGVLLLRQLRGSSRDESAPGRDESAPGRDESAPTGA